MARSAPSKADPKPTRAQTTDTKPSPGDTKPSPGDTKPSPGDETVQELIELVWDLGRAYYAYVGLIERVLVEQQLDHILRPGMGLVLFALYEEDNRTIKELANRSQLACSTLTGLLTRMETAGLVSRKRDCQDGRLVRVSLTRLGRKLEAKCRDMARQVASVAHSGVGLRNVAKTKGMLQGLTTAFRAEEQRLAALQSSARADNED